MNRLVLINNQSTTEYYPDHCGCCSMMDLYYSNSMFNRVVRKVILKAGLPLKKLIFNEWTEHLEQADAIIVFETGNIGEIVRWIRKRCPEKRIIVWYRNPVEKTVSVDEVKGIPGVEIWSFDPADCIRYGLRYNTQFFFRENLVPPEPPADAGPDVLYVGLDKNRAGTLHGLKTFFDERNISSEIHLVRAKDSVGNPWFPYQRSLKYREVVSKVSGTKAVIDLVSEGQSGLTLRPLEALLYRKKLITDMKSIIDFKIYDPKNVFILGVDDPEKLPAFISSPFDDAGYEVKGDYYFMENWLDRFDRQESRFDYKRPL